MFYTTGRLPVAPVPAVVTPLGWTLSGPPAKEIPGLEELMKRLEQMTPEQQESYVAGLSEAAQSGDKDALATLQLLAQMPKLLEQQARAQEDAVKAQAIRTAYEQGSRLAISLALPGVGSAVLKATNALKSATGGKVDPLGQQARAFQLLTEGRIGKAIDVYVTGLWRNVVGIAELPIKFIEDIIGVFEGKMPTGPLSLVIAPIAAVVGEIIKFFKNLFGLGPCEWADKSGCGGYTYWDGRTMSSGKCCNPSRSGMGVVFTEHGTGYKHFPGSFAVEVPAGDFVAAKEDEAARQPVLYEDYPNLGLGLPGRCSGVIVPPGYQVRIYADANFQGKSRDFGEGVHNLGKAGFHTVGSAKIRGPWTIWDARQGESLYLRRTGWITSWMDREPKREEIVSLLAGDVARPIPPDSLDEAVIPWDTTWAPSWASNLKRLGILDDPVTQELLKKLGVNPADADASEMVARFLKRREDELKARAAGNTTSGYPTVGRCANTPRRQAAVARLAQLSWRQLTNPRVVNGQTPHPSGWRGARSR